MCVIKFSEFFIIISLNSRIVDIFFNGLIRTSVINLNTGGKNRHANLAPEFGWEFKHKYCDSFPL